MNYNNGIAIVTDSNSGITQSEGREMGVCVIPMPFLINDEEFFEGICFCQPLGRGPLCTGEARYHVVPV